MTSPAIRGAIVGGIVAVVCWVTIAVLGEFSAFGGRVKLLLLLAAVLAPIVCVFAGAKIGSRWGAAREELVPKKK